MRLSRRMVGGAGKRSLFRSLCSISNICVYNDSHIRPITQLFDKMANEADFKTALNVFAIPALFDWTFRHRLSLLAAASASTSSSQQGEAYSGAVARGSFKCSRGKIYGNS